MEMSTEDYNYWKNTAYKVAKSYGRADLVEDFLSDMIMKILGGRKASVSQLFIDYLRQNVHDTRREYDSWRLNSHLSSSFDDEYMASSTDEHKADLNQIMDRLDDRERAIAILYYEWGLEMKEIGHVFGISECRISQVMSEIHKRLRKKLNVGRA